MAKGKGKAKTGSAGPHKKHGPKKKMFHKYSKTMRMEMARCGMLTKYNDRESFEASCTARGVKNITNELWNDFRKLETKEQCIEFFKNIKQNAIVAANKAEAKKAAREKALRESKEVKK